MPDYWKHSLLSLELHEVIHQPINLRRRCTGQRVPPLYAEVKLQDLP